MAGKFEAKNSLSGSFFIEESTLRNIVDFIMKAHATAKRPADVTVSAAFEETRTIETNDVDDLFKDPMLRSKSLKEVSIRCYSDLGYSSIYIYRDLEKPITYTINGERSWVLHLEDSVRNEAAASARWWGIFRNSTRVRQRISGALLTIFLLSFGGVFFAVHQEWKEAARILFLVALTLFVGKIIINLVNLTFPAVIFHFGRGAAQHKTRMKACNIVLGTIGLAVVVGLFTNWLGKITGIS
ncbi:hypothetical protein RJJ37_13080 [Rhizobium redzepovicii]|uniref:Uncharacterized protein n=1 Tax=Rhizobium redzepovicii TaxID=2867518 RepID=A0AAW8P0H7_9HYPH|nr:hypothetical protein [Rhizobium redzepovicii]MDR9760562.1 hypothetical protein [Rhizobium redzepovicii]